MSRGFVKEGDQEEIPIVPPIVGVDEADFSKGKISFTSPLARVLINKKIGDKAVLKRGQEALVFEILDIAHS